MTNGYVTPFCLMSGNRRMAPRTCQNIHTTISSLNVTECLYPSFKMSIRSME